MSPWLFNMHMDVEMKEVKIGMGRMGVIFLQEERDWRLPGLLYEKNLVLCGVSGEDLKRMMEHFVNVCRRRYLRVNADKRKVIILGGEEILECEICVHEPRLEKVSEFIYLWYNENRRNTQ